MTVTLVKPRQLPPTALSAPNIAGQRYNEWVVVLPPDHTLEDCLHPSYWAHYSTGRKLNKHDLIRVIAHDGSFDTTLTVADKVTGGVRVVPWPQYAPGFGPAFGAVAPSRPIAEPVPVPILPNGKAAVRIDYTDVTKFRVIGLDGEPIATGIEAEQDAIKKRDDYLKALNMRLPNEEEIAAEAARREARAAEIAAKDAARSGRRARSP